MELLSPFDESTPAPPTATIEMIEYGDDLASYREKIRRQRRQDATLRATLQNDEDVLILLGML